MEYANMTVIFIFYHEMKRVREGSHGDKKDCDDTHTQFLSRSRSDCALGSETYATFPPSYFTC